MKPGSLVQLINAKWRHKTDGVTFPETGKIYTVRDIVVSLPFKTEMIRLEEIVNPIAHTGQEWGFLSWRFKEVLPPIEDAESHIRENIVECPVVI
jgi:hypothetical protein